MLKNLNEKPHIVYGSVALIVGLAFVSAYFYSRTANIRIREAELASQKLEKILEEQTKKAQENERFFCLSEAKGAYDNYLELNGTKQKEEDGSVSYKMPTSDWEYVDSKLNDAEGLCIKKYPI